MTLAVTRPLASKTTPSGVPANMSWLNDPRKFRELNKWLAILWLLSFIPVVLIEGLAKSVPLLLFISIYANFAGHLSTWQGINIEIKMDEE